MINIYNATFTEIEACPRTLRTAIVVYIIEMYFFYPNALEYPVITEYSAGRKRNKHFILYYLIFMF
jgi:hypothetical protein